MGTLEQMANIISNPIYLSGVVLGGHLGGDFLGYVKGLVGNYNAKNQAKIQAEVNEQVKAWRTLNQQIEGGHYKGKPGNLLNVLVSHSRRSHLPKIYVDEAIHMANQVRSGTYQP